jgi:hypothetical protein
VLVITVQTRAAPGEAPRWAGRRHDDDRPDATSGRTPAELFDAVFAALHDGEQVALGFDCPLTAPASADGESTGQASADDLMERAGPAAGRPGIAELGHVLGELGTWRPWTTVSTSLRRWKANTSILVFQAVPAEGSGGFAASAAVESFFRQVRAPAGDGAEPAAGAVVNLAAAAARRAGLFVDESELARPPVIISVPGG